MKDGEGKKPRAAPGSTLHDLLHVYNLPHPGRHEVRGPEEVWRDLLLGKLPVLRFGRDLFLPIPSPPRCELCAVPFKGPLAPLLKRFGKGPLAKNPRYCEVCINSLLKHPGGAEVEMSALFADVRGSTPLAETLGPSATHEVMDRFYRTGVEALIRGGAIVDRFMGDQVVGYFVPVFAGANHAARAIETGLAILRDTGNVRGGTPSVPVGAGAHTGVAFVGTVGAGERLIEFTALGEDVNVAARLASVAGAGELVVSEPTFAAAGATMENERRQVELKGVSHPVAVRVLRPATN